MSPAVDVKRMFPWNLKEHCIVLYCTRRYSLICVITGFERPAYRSGQPHDEETPS